MQSSLSNMLSNRCVLERQLYNPGHVGTRLCWDQQEGHRQRSGALATQHQLALTDQCSAQVQLAGHYYSYYSLPLLSKSLLPLLLPSFLPLLLPLLLESLLLVLLPLLLPLSLLVLLPLCKLLFTQGISEPQLKAKCETCFRGGLG